MWPLFYLIANLIVMRSVDIKAIVGPAPPASGPPGWFLGLVGLHIMTIVLGVTVTLFYIWYALKSGHVPPGRRIPWAIALAVGNIVTVVPFFWRYVWPRNSEYVKSPVNRS
jgi:hypothetical protein